MKTIALLYLENLQIIYDAIMTTNYDNNPKEEAKGMKYQQKQILDKS